jgi:UDP-glucose 4-epimerase
MPGILVTGGAGSIASHAVDLFLDMDSEVVTPDLSTGCAASLNLGARSKHCATVRGAGLELAAAYIRDKEQVV